MADIIKTNEEGCRVTEELVQKICDDIAQNETAIAAMTPVLPATVVGNIESDNNESELSFDRAGSVGTSLLYAREDHQHPIVRLPNPGDPVLTYLRDTDSSLSSEAILDRWSDEESYSYRFRIFGTYGEGSGWNRITVPTKAGFQQPKILDIGTYRQQSTSPQDDDGNFGAAPRGPYMGKEAHHWSSTNLIYHAFFRRDNTYTMYTEFTVKYIRS